MKKIFCILLILSVAASAFSQDITINGTPPKVSDSTINSALESAFIGLKGDLSKEIGSLKLVPEDLIQAFGNASVYASHGATQRAYGGYKTFAVTFGSTFGAQLPVSPFKIVDYLEGLQSLEGDSFDNVLEGGDLKFGLNPQIINAQIGLNTSFLLKNLYLGLRIGYTPDLGGMLGSMMGGLDLSFSNFLIGVTANYQLIPSVSLAGLLTWRGVNLGAGLLFQHTKLDITYPFGTITENIGSTYTNAALQLDPNLYFNMKITTVTIPLEVMTAVKLLFINIPLGVGADVAFGKSEMNIGMRSDIRIVDPDNQLGNPTTGYLAINAGGSMAPKFFNLKLMTGIGFSFGPVLIDVPITYYFADDGLSIGITFGVAF